MTETDARAAPAGKPSYTPMQIAEHRLFTAKEKLDLLNRIKAELSGVVVSSEELGFSPSAVDEAIAAVRRSAQTGERVQTVVWGDN